MSEDQADFGDETPIDVINKLNLDFGPIKARRMVPTCGKCFHRQIETKPDGSLGSICANEPPKVFCFPIPVQSALRGQMGVQLQVVSAFPPIRDDQPACGRYTPPV